MKAYLLTYSPVCPQAQVHTVLNTTDAIRDWIAPFPYAAILNANLTTQELGAILRRRLDDEVWFMVAQLDSQLVDGWLPSDFWDYVDNPAEASLQQLLDRLSEKRKEKEVRQRHLRDRLFPSRTKAT